MLIQEMDLRLDLGFVYALAELMTEAEVSEKNEVRLKMIALTGKSWGRRRTKTIINF